MFRVLEHRCAGVYVLRFAGMALRRFALGLTVMSATAVSGLAAYTKLQASSPVTRWALVGTTRAFLAERYEGWLALCYICSYDDIHSQAVGWRVSPMWERPFSERLQGLGILWRKDMPLTYCPLPSWVTVSWPAPAPFPEGRGRWSAIYAPIWVWLLVLWAYPLGKLVLALRARLLVPWRRRRHGLCVRCGYSLRGLPEPRCPECGTPFDPKLRNTGGAPTSRPSPHV
jgi:hypothetical protein